MDPPSDHLPEEDLPDGEEESPAEEEDSLNTQAEAIMAPLSSEVAAELKELKKTRSTHLTVLRKQANNVIHACTEQLTKVDFSPCSKAWSEFKFEQAEYSKFCTDNKIEEADSKVNHMTIDAYFANAKSIYVDAKSVYENYLRGDPLDTKPSVSDSTASSAGAPSAALSSNLSNDFSFLRTGFGKQEYPQWDGKPGKPWLEFKTSWLHEVAPLFLRHPLALARILRKQVGGEAKKEIEHISLSDENCYKLMWEALINRYDNIALNVHTIMSAFDKFKPVHENDRPGLLRLIRDLKCAHSQLNAIGHVDQVDNLVVTKLVSLLPNNLQLDWASKFSGLTSTQRFHPFDEFIKLLESKRTVIQALVEISTTANLSANLSSSSSNRQERRASARSHAIQTGDKSRTCLFHPNAPHTTAECRKFLKMSCRERFNLCENKGLCKRCIAPKHGNCTGRCSHCVGDGAGTHCDLLCFAKEETLEGKPVNKPYGQSNDRSFPAPRQNALSGQSSDPVTPYGPVSPQNAPHQLPPCPHFYGVPGGSINMAGIAQTLPPYMVPMPYNLGMLQQSLPPYVYYQYGPGVQTMNQAGAHAGPPGIPVVTTTVTGSVGSNATTLATGTAQSSFTPPGSSTHPPSKSDATNTTPSGFHVKNNSAHVSMSTKIFKVSQKPPSKKEKQYESLAMREHALGVYAIYECKVSNSDDNAVIFCDDGSDCSLITEEGAKRLNAFKVSHGWMDMTTLHGTHSVPTNLCEVPLVLPSGARKVIVCFTVPTLCGMPSTLDEKVLKEAFPGADIPALRRPTQEVNMLLGSDYFSLHPKHEIHCDGNLSVMQGALGVTVQGSHPKLIKTTTVNPYAGYRLAYRESYKVSLYRTDIPVHHVFGSIDKADAFTFAAIPSDGVPKDDVASASMARQPDADPVPLGSSYAVNLPVGESAPNIPTEMSSQTSATRSSGEEPDRAPALPAVCPTSFALAKGAFGPAVDEFILGEELGTVCIPRCGSCKCGKCPLPGHHFSFKEEQELELIQSKLRYLENPGRWICGYPWLIDPATLPDNYAAVYATLVRTERTLLREPEWKDVYHAQIIEHEARGVARKLTPEEIASWEGPYLYISHMCLEQPKSESTPVRVVFNSSQKFKGISLNDCLAKGPDCYNNSLLGMLIRFRENQTVIIGDIKKMFNTVHLEELEQHMHRFLWRECDTSRKPDIWVITRVNLGDRPSGTIAITAKNNTAHMFADICPPAAQMLIYCTYTDDVINSIKGGFPQALFLASKAEEILQKGEFKVKGWTFGGAEVPDEYKKQKPSQVLGAFYDSLLDYLFFPAKLNFSKRRRGVPTGPDLCEEDVAHKAPDELTRRIVLAVVMGIYDPLGLLSPFVLNAKLLLRRTWELKLGWDEVMEEALVRDWKTFFIQMFEAARIRFPRCLTPEDAVGLPQLVVLSDGSEVAYGCAAYVRWRLADGGFWCRLVMAKSRIAPLNRITIPQMELNGAVLSKRIREAIESESRFEFERIHHIIDSETVLCQLYKVAQKFRVFEGVRIGEIQAATNGNMAEWAWVAGSENVADMATRPQTPAALTEDSIWQRGPDFLYLPESEWPVKRNPHVAQPAEMSPGEKVYTHCTTVCSNVCFCSAHCKLHVRTHNKTNEICKNSVLRCGQLNISVGGIGRAIAAFRAKSLRGAGFAPPDCRQKALRCIIEEAQCVAWPSFDDVVKCFRHINVTVCDQLYVVESRDPRSLSPDHQPQVLLPYSHPFTYKAMRECHELGRHAGRDATLSRFRSKYHTPRAHRIAAAVCRNCTHCKLHKVKLLGQKMGTLPAARFLPSPPFNQSVLDLFGPYLIRGEKNPRICNIKVWGVMIVDLVSRGVHIELSCGYDTASFLVAFRRFAALRGWPSTIYSDPGTQLVGASKEVRAAWDGLQGDDGARSTLSRQGTQWIFGPADSPWYQGAAEALIKSAKLAITQTVHHSRLTFSEMHTAFSEVANLLNERPIGYSPSNDNEINILTPNNLLLGRSTCHNPGGFEPTCSLLSRVNAVKDLVDSFWEAWTQLYAPTLIKQSKWSHEERPLRVGDIVLVADSNVMRGEYRLARVSAVHPSKDGLVRRVTIEYVVYKSITKDMKLVDGRASTLERSVQRLALIIPVEEMGLSPVNSMGDVDGCKS